MFHENYGVRKLFRQDFSTNFKSSDPMVKMTNRKIKLGIDWVLKKGETVNQVAYTFDISPRRVAGLCHISSLITIVR